ncbi:Ankyrin repeat domain-containing protein 50 [Fusarium oxysporum f. sp. albedinis]|nr:Ankyrin repeat domain-containing protein 50 [Fusarium oxysporum f. sp. albedinis]
MSNLRRASSDNIASASASPISAPSTPSLNKYLLCKYHHISSHHDAALFASESTTGIICHLKQQHRMEKFGYKSTGPDPFSIAKRAASFTPYLRTHQCTNKIFTNYLEDIGKILPKSPSTLGSWVKEKWVGDAERRVWLRARLHSSKGKVCISTDAWTFEEVTDYLAVVTHFLGANHKL